ncbi:hypothetical protein SDC9_157551 [bioreactor metagenome]|uniref:Tripartite ATP-independent periplasmic transporters DctQ component domain-containing protein n=1 Tax=bioreactor metagenome TaxID=1076179 RepID=A0A645F9F7_9ZZZZ
MCNVIKQLHRALFKVETWFLIISFTVMGIIMALQVFSRAILGKSIVWSEELTRHIFIWSTFIGMSYGVARMSHINLDYFILKIAPMPRKAIAIIMDVILLGALFVLFRASIIYVGDQIEIAGPTTGYSMGYVMLAMPVSCVLASIHSVHNIVQKIVTFKSER